MLRVPRGDPKKTDVRVSQEQLDTLEKFKGPWVGAGEAGVMQCGCLPCPASNAVECGSTWCMHMPVVTELAALIPAELIAAACSPAPLPPESAYKCGVQVCFSVVLLTIGLSKP